MTLSLDGGDAGGVSRPQVGTGPGEHTGRCLFGMGVGVPRDRALSARCGGGVDERLGKGGARATAAAIAKGVYVDPVCTLKVRSANGDRFTEEGEDGEARQDASWDLRRRTRQSSLPNQQQTGGN